MKRKSPKDEAACLRQALTIIEKFAFETEDQIDGQYDDHREREFCGYLQFIKTIATKALNDKGPI